MADLLLTHGYFLYDDPKELQIMKPYPPLGLLYITSHLRSKGFDVEVFDSTFSTYDLLVRHLRATPPAVMGVYANLMTRRNVVKILSAAKESGWQTIVGGPEPGAYVREYLEAGADVVVFGEGEVTVEELIPALRLREKVALANSAGIAFLDDDGALHQTGPRATVRDLDAQPWPARDAIDMSRYLKTWRDAHGQGSVSLITARGCPYRCRWCSHQVFGQTHRRRTPALVVDELEWLIQTYSPEIAWIADDVFTINHAWVRAYAAEMKKRGLRIPFECISRADRLTPEITDLMADLGCFRIWIGSESGSQRVLDAMERGVELQEVQRAVEMCRERGIQTGMFLMWGYEGEQLADIESTIEHVKRADPDIFFTTVAYPIKGTPYYAQVADRVVAPKPWRESSDRDLLIKGRHSRSFYEYADRLLKDEVALTRLSRSNSPDDRAVADLAVRIAQARTGLSMTADEVEA
jgi:radical SAM superfamily enzyme YgiQ (UPF0313 family)